jgi:hypothetical protein
MRRRIYTESILSKTASKIFSAREEDVTGGWKILHYEMAHTYFQEDRVAGKSSMHE